MFLRDEPWHYCTKVFIASSIVPCLEEENHMLTVAFVCSEEREKNVSGQTDE